MSPFFPQATSFFILSLWKDNEIVNSLHCVNSAVFQRLGAHDYYGKPPKDHKILK